MKSKQYFKNIETGHIYKEAGDKFGYQYLKVTPWETGEDRRTNINELKKLELEGKVVKIPFAKAREELNAIWNNTDRYWEHDGKEYCSLSNVNLFEYRTMPPGHSWDHKWKDMQGNERAKGKTANLWRYRALAGGFYIFKHEYVMVFQKP